MRDDTHDPSVVIDRVDPVDATHAARPRIDVDDPGPAETAWQSAIDRAALPRWHPGPAGLVLVVSPHPDDETVAVGGLLHDLVAAGWRVRLASVTDGEAAYPAVSGLGAVRRRELASALDRLGIADATVIHRLELARRARRAMPGRARGAAWNPSLPECHGSWPRGAMTAIRITRRAAGPPPRWSREAAAGRFDSSPSGPGNGPRPNHRWRAPCSPPPSAATCRSSALHAKRAALRAFASQQDGILGPAILPSHVLDRFARPFEVLLR